MRAFGVWFKDTCMLQQRPSLYKAFALLGNLIVTLLFKFWTTLPSPISTGAGCKTVLTYVGQMPQYNVWVPQYNVWVPQYNLFGCPNITSLEAKI